MLNKERRDGEPRSDAESEKIASEKSEEPIEVHESESQDEESLMNDLSQDSF